MCIAKYSRKVAQLKKQVAKDSTKQNELDEAVADINKGLIHRHVLGEFTFFFVLKSVLSNLIMKAGRSVMVKFGARPPVFITYPAQVERIFEMANELADKWNLNKKYF